MGAAALPSFDPFQDNSPLLGNNDDDHDTRGISDIVNVPVQVKEGFVNSIVDGDDNEEKMIFTYARRKTMMMLSTVETLLTLLLMMKNRLINP